MSGGVPAWGGSGRGVDGNGLVIAVLALVALVGAACGPAAQPEAEPSEAEAVASPAATEEEPTYEVGVDGATDEVNAMFLHFFPDCLTVHPGATINFSRPENGEIHTVSLGSRVPTDGALGGQEFFQGGFGGEPRTSASMPCFLDEGLPTSDGCPAEQRTPSTFDGTQSWFSSGGMLGADTFTLELADDIAPGSYPFVCLVHAPDMQGTIEVVDPDDPADEPADVTARGDEELEEAVDAIRSKVDEGPSVRPRDDQVVAAMHTGSALFGIPPRDWALVFTPEDVEVPVGGTVTWLIVGDHTISFNAPESARPFYERDDDGSVRENALAKQRQGDPAGWDGTGVLNSGLRTGFSPPDRFSVTFTEPGTYPYRCLIHFDMEGRVTVS